LLLHAAELAAAEDRTFTVTSGYFFRKRTDAHIKEPLWPSQEMKSNVINTVFDLSSGYLGGWVKADLGWIGALNFEKDYRCSEVAFCSKKNDSEDGRTQIWAHNDLDGLALYRATLGVQSQTGSINWRWRAGYDQFNAGVLGNNWGFLFPGSYRGTQLDASWGAFHFNYAWTDAYRTPWATEYGYFLDAVGERIKEIQSAGAKYTFASGLFLEAGAGLATGWQKRHFSKAGWQGKTGAYEVSANVQHYRYEVLGEDYIGRENRGGEQNIISLGLTTRDWSLSLEYVGTQVNFWYAVPEFVPRMSAGYGNSQGRLDYWWNAVSDFNKDGERALNLGFKPAPWTAGAWAITSGINLISATHISGYAGDRRRSDRSGYERGYNLDLGFSSTEGPWKPLTTSIHYTHLKAGGKNIDPNDPASLYARYGLYSTNDWKIMLVYSLSFSG
jgi:hypothetical protein